jgi:beta-mannosidase
LRCARYDAVSVATGSIRVDCAARQKLELSVDSILGAFIDSSFAYRFGPRAFDFLEIELLPSNECHQSYRQEVVFHPPSRGLLPLEDLELQTSLRQISGQWELHLTARRFAQALAISVPGFRPEDNYFHLSPGRSRSITLRAQPGAGDPVGVIAALNGQRRQAIRP